MEWCPKGWQLDVGSRRQLLSSSWALGRGSPPSLEIPLGANRRLAQRLDAPALVGSSLRSSRQRSSQRHLQGALHRHGSVHKQRSGPLIQRHDPTVSERLHPFHDRWNPWILETSLYSIPLNYLHICTLRTDLQTLAHHSTIFTDLSALHMKHPIPVKAPPGITHSTPSPNSFASLHTLW